MALRTIDHTTADVVGDGDFATVKIALGAEGFFNGFICAANPMPVTIASAVTLNVTELVGVDVTDRGARLLGHVTVDNAFATDAGLQSVWTRLGDGSTHVVVDSMPAVTIGSVDVTDRSARVLGHVVVDSLSGTVSVSAASLPLPTGAATESTLSAFSAKTPTAAALADATANPSTYHAASDLFLFNGATWDRARGSTANGLVVDVSRIQGTVTVNGSGVTQPVSAASLPLPSGAATAALQTTIDTDIKATQPRDVTDRSARLLGHVTVDSLPSVAVNNFPAVQPVSFSSAIAQGSPNTAANSWPVAITDGTNVLGTAAHPVRTDTTGTTTQPISAASLPLPTGAATDASLTATQPRDVTDRAARLLGHVTVDTLPSIPTGANTIGKVDQGAAGAAAWKVDGSAVTQPVSATALPLPSGAATSALQTAGNTSVASIDGKTPPLGAAATAASVPVNIASDQTVPVSVAALTSGSALFQMVDEYGLNEGTRIRRMLESVVLLLTEQNELLRKLTG